MTIRRIGATHVGFATALLVLTGAFASQAAAQGHNTEQTVRVGAATRSFLLHLPSGYRPGETLALVVVFHGGGGNANNAARMSGMDTKADKEHFIVAYPNGSGPVSGALLTWNAGNCCGYALDNNVDDVAFVRSMVDLIAFRYPSSVDRKRIYATGLSNGGMMTYRIACEAADLFAAVAPVAGAMGTDDCRPAIPVSVIIFHGTADQHVRFDGGAPTRTVDMRHPRVDKSVSFAVDFWARHDHCDATPTRETKGHVTHTAYACGANAVELYAVEGQGHAWPGGEKGIRAGNVDAPSTEISATDLMWDFFARHPKK